MAPENPTPTNQVAGRGNEGDNPEGDKLIAGKYKTIEDAVEHGIGGLEKGYHDLSEKFSALTKVLEAALATDPGPPQPVSPVRSGTPDPYGRYPQPLNEDEINPADFITNPGKHLREREDRLVERISKAVVDIVGNSSAVSDFKSRNSDLVKHERLVRAYMAETDPRKSVADRLEDAGKKAREYLATLKAEFAGGGQPPVGPDYVEAPRGPAGPFAPPTPASIAEAEAAEAVELAAYIRERNADMASHFGVNVQKKE